MATAVRLGSPGPMQEIEIKFSLTHNTVGIPTIYLIEEFDKLEYEGPTVGPAKMIRDATNQTIAHPLVKQPKMRK